MIDKLRKFGKLNFNEERTAMGLQLVVIAIFSIFILVVAIVNRAWPPATAQFAELRFPALATYGIPVWLGLAMVAPIFILRRKHFGWWIELIVVIPLVLLTWSDAITMNRVSEVRSWVDGPFVYGVAVWNFILAGIMTSAAVACVFRALRGRRLADITVTK